jgi:Transcription elongation factor, GreA/GreB, C-term
MDDQNATQPAYEPLAGIGTHVEIELIYGSGERENLSFDLVAEAQADYYAGFLSESTPLAQAILGRRAGMTIPYQAGDARAIRILAISFSTRQPEADRDARRQKVIKQAVEESEFKNRLAVATSMGNKWGDLDADGYIKSQEEES